MLVNQFMTFAVIFSTIDEVLRYTYVSQLKSKMAELPEKAFKVILIGATGATGKLLFTELVKAREFSEITVLGRRKATLHQEIVDVDLAEQERSGRVKQYIIDFENISEGTVGKYFEEKDVFFSCMGTTLRQAGSASNFTRIDHGFNYNLAKIAQEKKVRFFSLISTQGANKDSYFLYLQSKGKLEHDCGNLGFSDYSIFRPGFLDRGKDSRVVEKIAGLFVNRMPVHDVAKAMCSNALQVLSSPEHVSAKREIFYNNQILHMSETYNLNQ